MKILNIILEEKTEEGLGNSLAKGFDKLTNRPKDPNKEKHKLFMIRLDEFDLNDNGKYKGDIYETISYKNVAKPNITKDVYILKNLRTGEQVNVDANELWSKEKELNAEPLYASALVWFYITTYKKTYGADKETLINMIEDTINNYNKLCDVVANGGKVLLNAGTEIIANISDIYDSSYDKEIKLREPYEVEIKSNPKQLKFTDLEFRNNFKNIKAYDSTHDKSIEIKDLNYNLVKIL